MVVQAIIEGVFDSLPGDRFLSLDGLGIEGHRLHPALGRAVVLIAGWYVEAGHRSCGKPWVVDVRHELATTDCAQGWWRLLS